MTPPFPEFPDGCDYLLEALLILNPLRQTDMGGDRPVDWQEIVPFAWGTNRVELGEDVEILRRAACAYYSGYQAGRKPLGIMPMTRGLRAS